MTEWDRLNAAMVKIRADFPAVYRAMQDLPDPFAPLVAIVTAHDEWGTDRALVGREAVTSTPSSGTVISADEGGGGRIPDGGPESIDRYSVGERQDIIDAGRGHLL
jgi:hypothetical protein